MEILIQDFFEKHLKDLGVKYKREYRLDNSVIDFIAEFNSRICGVEVKSSYSDVYIAIGQLINFSRYFSDLILIATKEFIHKFNEITEKTGVLKQIGIILFENGGFAEFRKPSPRDYYFIEGKKLKEKKELYGRGITSDRFTTEEEKFFKKFKNEPFMYHNVAKETKKKFGAAYRFIGTLIKLGLVEEVNRGMHPKMFKTTNKLYEIIHI